MIKKLSFPMIILSSFLVLFVTNLIADEPPDDVIIENEGYKTDRKGPVKLSHLNHTEDYEIACISCHHDYQEGQNVWNEGDPVKKCASCHDLNENKGEIKKLSIAYHKNCKGCHKDLARTGESEDAPFKKCTECHQNKS